mmetsp:Transcript_8455/g.24855  ORF Transcript_8455/g.24855 Transcript_8455/m.24855 type:complete len:487 (+) Transcript_8455:2485-3945(+)
MSHRPHHVVAWEVLSEEDALHAGHGARRGRVDARDSRRGTRALHQPGVQHARRWRHVVNVDGLTSRVQVAGRVRGRFTRATFAVRAGDRSAAPAVGRVVGRVGGAVGRGAGLDRRGRGLGEDVGVEARRDFGAQRVRLQPCRGWLRLSHKRARGGACGRVHGGGGGEAGARPGLGDAGREVLAALDVELEEEGGGEGRSELRLPARRARWHADLGAQRVGSCSEGVVAPLLAHEGGGGLGREDGGGREAAERQRRVLDAPRRPIGRGREACAEGGGDNGDIILASTRLLVRFHDLDMNHGATARGRGGGHAHAHDELVLGKVHLAVALKEGRHGHGARAPRRGGHVQLGARSREEGIHVADGGGGGEVAAEARGVADLVGGEPAEHARRGLGHGVHGRARVARRLHRAQRRGGAEDAPALRDSHLTQLCNVSRAQHRPRGGLLEARLDAHLRVAHDDADAGHGGFNGQRVRKRGGLPPRRVRGLDA